MKYVDMLVTEEEKSIIQEIRSLTNKHAVREALKKEMIDSINKLLALDSRHTEENPFILQPLSDEHLDLVKMFIRSF